MPGKTRGSLSSRSAMKPKAKLPEDEIIEILESDDEDTKEQCSVNEDSCRDIQDQKPAAKGPREVAIDNLCRELKEVFKLLEQKEKRKISDAFEPRETKKRKISDASHESPQLKAPPRAAVSPNQGEAWVDKKDVDYPLELVNAELNTKHTMEATSDANENSNFEALLKTAGEEQQRLQAAADMDDTEAPTMQAEDLVDRSMPDDASAVDGTPQDADYLAVEVSQDSTCLADEVSQDPNCLAVEHAVTEAPTPETETTGESNAELENEAVESSHQTEESGEELDNEDVEYYMFPEALDESEEASLIEYEEAETCDVPLNSRVSATIQWIKDILPPSFGSCFLFVCGLCCVYVDRLAAVKFALCLLVFCFNVGNAVVETESGDKPVFCVSLPKNPSKSWRALVLAICMVGFVTVINVISSLGEKVANRLQVKPQLA